MGPLEHLTAALADRYHIERELGAGGMATVYLAEDLKHHRQVAIKVLKPELAAVIGAERFLQEIRTIATLQHPHILGLIDSGDVQGTAYYVMPYIAGESLRDRLTREKQLPVMDAVRIAGEVATALDYAHRHGVIHRDIKPENILLHDGQAMVADFGIALAVSSAAGSRMTETGLSLGTPHYMSPEQAMGERDITPRSDVYALGAMTYEMLSGDPPFTGSTAQAIVAKVMSEEPAPLRRYRKAVPEAVEVAVLTALEKLPADRFASAAEFAAALVNGPAARRPGGSTARRLEGLAAMVGAVLLLGVSAGWLIAGRRSAPEAAVFPPSRLALLAPDVGGTGVASQYRQIQITPDGSAVVFVTLDSMSVNAIAIQRLDAATPSLIEGSRGIVAPFLSPDGKFVSGWAAGVASGEKEHSRRLPISGGTASVMPADIQSNHAQWATDGTIWFTPVVGGGLQRMAPDGGISDGPGESSDRLRLQQLLADGRRALATELSANVATGPVVMVDLETGATSPVLEQNVFEARLAAGFLLYVNSDGSMWAVTFNHETGRTEGSPALIAEGVDVNASPVVQWAVAPTGTIAYIPSAPQSLMLVRRDGSMRAAAPDRNRYHAPKFSPDGREISVDLVAGHARDVWIVTPRQRTLSRITFTGDGHDATWAPDGHSLVFTSFFGSNTGVRQTRPGGGAVAESLFASPKLSYTGSWTPDGRGLITVANDLAPGSGLDIGMIGGNGRGPLTPVVADPFAAQYPDLSPDGKWLAYVSNKSGIQQVYVRPLADGGLETLVSRNGGTEPLWGPDGRELFFLSTGGGRRELVSAAVRTEPSFEVTNRRTLFDASQFLGSNPHANYDISPDGRDFVMVRGNPANRIIILQNLPELVRRIRSQ